MKTLSLSIASFAVFALAFALIATPVMASSGEHDCECSFDSGRAFGEHVSMHAQMGHLGGDMNPGTHHKGFSPWAPGN